MERLRRSAAPFGLHKYKNYRGQARPGAGGQWPPLLVAPNSQTKRKNEIKAKPERASQPSQRQKKRKGKRERADRLRCPAQPVMKGRQPPPQCLGYGSSAPPFPRTYVTHTCHAHTHRFLPPSSLSLRVSPLTINRPVARPLAGRNPKCRTHTWMGIDVLEGHISTYARK